MVKPSDTIWQSAARSREECDRAAWEARQEKRNAFYRRHGRWPGFWGYLGHLHRVGAAGFKQCRAEQKAARAHPLFFVRRILFWLWLSGAVGCFCALAANDPTNKSEERTWANVAIAAGWPGVLVAAWVFHRFDFDRDAVTPTPIAEATNA